MNAFESLPPPLLWPNEQLSIAWATDRTNQSIEKEKKHEMLLVTIQRVPISNRVGYALFTAVQINKSA